MTERHEPPATDGKATGNGTTHASGSTEAGGTAAAADDMGTAENDAAADTADSGYAHGGDPEALVTRLRRNAIGSLVVLTAGTAFVTLEPGPILGVLLSGALMIVNFEVLERVIGRVLEEAPEGAPGAAQMLFLAFRLVLLALLLCGIFLVPGITPISVALGLSVLVLAVLIEASTQVLSG